VKKGDRVRMSPMWKYDTAVGVILNINKEGYVIVRWDGINGDWYYTESQAKKIELILESHST